MDYCKYADPFYFVKNQGPASDVYNKTLSAMLPFGKISAGLYPLDFGKDGENKILTRGVSDFYHIETKNNGYYNYATLIPFYNDVSDMGNLSEVSNFDAQTGYYKMTIGDTDLEVTLSKDTVYHHFYFEKQNGRVGIDFSSDKLLKQPYVEITPFGEVLFSATVSAETYYFCALAECENPKVTLFENLLQTDKKSINPDGQKPFGAIFDFDGNGIIIKIAHSTIGFDDAKQKARCAIDSFDTVMNKAYAMWGKYLSRIEIETEDEEIKYKFYSFLYHILEKGIDITEENFKKFDKTIISEADFDQVIKRGKLIFPIIEKD